jgi:hypothetical protein
MILRDKLIQFLYDDEELYDGTVQSICATPYSEDENFEIHTYQVADTVRITHKDYSPRILSRVTATEFTLDEIDFRKGPFLVRNDLKDPLNPSTITLRCNTLTKGSTGTLVASAATFESGHVGALFKLIHKRTVTSISLEGNGTSAEIDVKGTYYFITAGTWSGKCILQRQENGSDWTDFRTFEALISGARNDSIPSAAVVESEDNIKYRIFATNMVGNFSATLNVYDPDRNGIVRILSVESTTSATVEVISSLELVTATTRWAEGAWSTKNGFPSSLTFLNNRCIYFGFSNNLLTVWLSRVGDYENFEEGVKDDDAFTIPIESQNDPCWIGVSEWIALGTKGDEWKIGTNKFGTPITPLNWNVRRQSEMGSSPIQPIGMNQSVLFVDFVARKIREMTYLPDKEKCESPDLTVLAEHITASGITSMSRQKNPDSIIWATLGNGQPVAMVYDRDQNVIAWAKYPLGGDGFAQCVCVLPGEDEDSVYFSVQRSNNDEPLYYGTEPLYYGDEPLVYPMGDYTYVEKLSSRTLTSLEDCFFVDCGKVKGSMDDAEIIDVLSNGHFDLWTLGAASVPDGWTIGGAGASIAQEDTTIKSGLYSAKLTRAGADCQLMQDITPVEYWRGKTVTFGCWVYATVAGRAMAYITDNIGSAASSYHTGDSTWQWLTVTYKVNANATFLRVMPYIATDDTAAYFDGAKFSYLKPSTTIAGLDIHEGKTLSVFADGVRFDDDVVENGFITASLSGVATPYTKAIVGLPYTAILQPKRIVMNTPSGSSMGKTTHVSGLVISFMNTGAAKYGVDMDHLFSIDFTDIRWTNSSTITGLFSGEVTVPCPGNFDPLNPIFITSDGPMPLTVRAICPEIEAR